MAENLQFKKGLLANLNNAPKSAGTIYITTDERAMYVDISNSERIRLGDFIEVATMDDLKAAKYQPYQSTALYYVVDGNKLLKYIGTSGSDANFRVINATASIESDISDLQALVGQHTTAIGDLQSNLSTLTTTVTDNKTATDNAISALTNTVNTNKTNIEQALADEVTRATVAEQANATNITALNTAVEDLANTKADKTALAQEVQDRQSAINTVNGTISGINTRVQTLEGHVGSATSGLLKDVADLKSTTNTQGTAINDLRDDHDALADTVGTARNEINTLKTTVGDNTSGLVKDVADLKNAVGSNDGDISALRDRVSETERVNGLQNTAITDLQTAVGSAKNGSTPATGLHLAIDQLKAKDQTIEGDITNLQNADTALGNRVTTLETNSATKTELAETNTAVSNLSNSKVDKTTYEAKVQELVQEDARLAGLIGTNANNISTLDNALNNSTNGVIVRLNNLEATDAEHTTAISNLNTSLNNYVLKTDHTRDINAVNKSISDQGVLVAANTGNIATNTTAIGQNATAIGQNTAAIGQNATAISNLQEAVGSASSDTQGKDLYSWIEELLDKDEWLQNYIDNGFKAADAMTFVGGTADADSLFALSGDAVNAGDTYVMTAKDGDYAIGDLLIAIEDGVSGKANWTHVPSGYVAAHDPKLHYNDEHSIKLQSQASGANLGIVTFEAAENSSIEVKVTHDDDENKPVVTIGMSWGSF